METGADRIDLAALVPHRIELGAEVGAATVNGIVGARSADVYLVRGGGGQRMIVTLSAEGGGVFLGLAGAGGGPPLVALDAELQSWEGHLPASGDYTLYVAGTGANRAYSLHVALPEPPPPPVPAPSADASLIYLTFDDGPDPGYTPQVLDLLARYGARATFFVIGRHAAAHPDLLARIVAEGHQVANHTYNHVALAGIDRDRFRREVQQAQVVLGPAAAPCLRPPYGSRDAHTFEYAAELGLRVVLWTIDPSDWSSPGADAIADHVLARAQPGSIVLLHDGGGDRSQTVAALEPILAGLTARGFQFGLVC